jgi:hypothetical protein
MLQVAFLECTHHSHCVCLIQRNELIFAAVQHARPYRALVHDIAGLQRNVGFILVFAACFLCIAIRL